METIEKLGERLEAMEHRARMMEQRAALVAHSSLCFGSGRLGHPAASRRNSTRTIIVRKSDGAKTRRPRVQAPVYQWRSQ